MEPKRFLLEGASLDELKARILAEHGADARIVAADRVTVGGIRGFFAKRHFEVTVEVPERRRRAAHARLDVQARLGIAALLDDADAAETRLQSGAEPTLSTVSADFAHLMDELTFQAEPEPAPVVLTATRSRAARPLGADDPLGQSRPFVAGDPLDADLLDADLLDADLLDADLLDADLPSGSAPTPTAVTASSPDGRNSERLARQSAERLNDLTRGQSARQGGRLSARQLAGPVPPVRDIPRPLSGHGDLVVLVGLPDAAIQVARSMALSGSGEMLVAGSAGSDRAERADDRRTALSARARGVERGHTGFVAFGLGGDLADSMALVAALAETLAPIGADQVWLVVDAGRKPSDTGRWAAALAAITQIDAVAVVGAATTGTPGTVDELGLPIGWVDGSPATATTLADGSRLPGRADRPR